jgi:predicted nucleic acid-binding protein
MSEGRTEAVVLDANVLYPAPLRDLLLNAAGMKLYRPLWSNDIQEEWVKNLLADRSDLSEAKMRKTVIAMNKAFPDAQVRNYKARINKLLLPDPDDRHVLAAAIQGKASVITTINLKDFPARSLIRYGLKAQHPDEFIFKLIERDEQGMLDALNNQVRNLRNPPLPMTRILENLEVNGLMRSVGKLRELLK